MEQWQTGDTTAFETLFRQYGRFVYTNAYFISGSRDDAEEIVQEVFVSVWKSRQSFDPVKGKITTWLHKITLNECFERQRKKRPVAMPIENIDLPDGDGSEDAIMNKYDCERVMGAIASLDKKHRAVLVLRYFNELSYKEIAATMNIPSGTVKSRIYTALKTVREQLGIERGEAYEG